MRLPRRPGVVGQPYALPRISLRARIVVIVVAATVIAMLLFGSIVLAVLRADRISRVDDLLEGQSVPLINESLQLTNGVNSGVAEGNLFPSDYVVVFINKDGSLLIPTVESSTIRDRVGVPNVRDIENQSRRGVFGEPYTVAPAQGDTPWRALTLSVKDSSLQSVTVALPLDADQAVREIGGRAALVGLGIAAAAALLGWWAVNRSLRPLRSVETTAAAIAAGDFARRVPEGSQDTEIGRLTAALNGMLGHIEAAISDREASRDRMRRFVSDASHELRTPLAAIRGFAELHRQGAVPPDEVAQTFARVEGEARRMGRLVEDLLLLARLDEQRPMHSDPVDLSVLVFDTAASVGALDPTREVRVIGEFGGPLLPVLVTGDADRLRQVLANLAANAVRHTPPGSPVELGLRQRGDWAVIEVADHGPGIGEADKGRVFDRFTRLDRSRHRGGGGGAGLGLSIVAGVVAAHSGRVEVADTPGGGATLRVWLPTVAAVTATRPAGDGSDEQLAGGEVAVHV